MTSFLDDRAPSKAGSTVQHQKTRQDRPSHSAGSAMPPGAATAKQDLLIQEFAAELTPSPEELAAALSAAGLSLTGTEGLIYDPFADEWRLGPDTDVNYFANATRG